MDGHQSTNGGSDVALYEDVLDEDDKRLIIDEGCLPSEDNHERFTGEEVPRLLKLNSRKDVQETATIYPCPDCGKMFRRKVKLQAHLLTHKSKDDLECENCGRKFRKVDALFSHVCSGFGNCYKCPDCDEWFRLKRDLAAHQLTHKKASTSEGASEEKDPPEGLSFSSFVASFVKWPVTCTHCGAELTDLESYNLHMAAHKEGEPCVCSVCKMKFSCRDDYLLHKDLCHIEGIFECTSCSKRFHTEKKLSEHLESHGGEGVSCDVCRVSFASKEKLLAHKKLHKTSIFVCGKCKKIFKCNRSFKNHTCSVSENREKKFYTFADIPEKKLNDQCTDSLSANEESDSEDVDICNAVSESHLCKVCGDSFEQKEGLILHLATHFQCVECKKYFKAQSDLDLHTFMIADEKLYSCCLCEAIIHGKKELECHLSHHLASDDAACDDSEWDDNTEVFHNVIPSLDAAEPLQSTLLERSVKIHKVIPTGNNSLKCSSCGKLVLPHHNLSAHIEPNTQVADSEEYVYISRLGSPQNKAKQTDEAHCTCHPSADVLSSLMEQIPGKSFTEYEYQEAQKIINASQISTHFPPPNSTSEESVNSKSKSLLNDTPEDTMVHLDTSNEKGSHSDRPNSVQILKPEVETSCKALLNRDLTNSVASSTAELVMKDSKDKSDGSKADTPNAEVEDKKEENAPKKAAIKIIKLDDKSESLPVKVTKKEYMTNINVGKGNPLGKPLKILVSTGLFLGPTSNFAALSESLTGNDAKNTIPVVRCSTKKKVHPPSNIVNQEIVLPSLTAKDGGKSFNESPVSTPKKIKQENPTMNLSPPQVKNNRIELVSSHSDGNPVKISNGKRLTVEPKPYRVKGEKRKKTSHPALNPLPSDIDVTEAKHSGKTKALGKTDPIMLRVSDNKTRPAKRRTQFAKREQEKDKTRPNSSTPNVNGGGDGSFIPESNMIFKVEQLGCESDEDDEDEPLDFSGIKKEFLASDVFIKEEEWDIVDF